jgi:hypothetical protein
MHLCCAPYGSIRRAGLAFDAKFSSLQAEYALLYVVSRAVSALPLDAS